MFDLSGQSVGHFLNAQRRKTSADRVILQRSRCTEHRHDPVAGELARRFRRSASPPQQNARTSSVMISRSRSAPTVAAMSIECTTSANRTVTCLYSADRLICVTGAPHSLQNLEFGGSSMPHDPTAVPSRSRPPLTTLLSSTSVSCHRWSAMSVVSPCHLRHEVLRPSYVIVFETISRQLRSGLSARFPQPSRSNRGSFTQLEPSRP